MTSFGGIFQVEDLFNRLFSKLIDASLGQSSPLGKAYQFSEVFCNVTSTYLCGGEQIEDFTTYLGRDLNLSPNARVAISLKQIETLFYNNPELLVHRIPNSQGNLSFKSFCIYPQSV